MSAPHTYMTPQGSPLTEGETPRRVLFVCSGNTCRSPMAAALYNDRAIRENAASRAASAGVYPEEGTPISKNAAAALAAAGIASTEQNPYLSHRARRVTREMIETADLVVGITASHAMELILRFPDLAGKIVAFPMDISDPYGGDEERYRACLGELMLGMAFLCPSGGEEA